VCARARVYVYFVIMCMRSSVTRACAQSPMYEIELLSTSRLRACFGTPDPDSAHYFMLPHRSTCVMHNIILRMATIVWGAPTYPGYLPPGEAAAREVARNYTEPLFNRMRSRWPYFNASGGADHIMAFGHGRGSSWFTAHMSPDARSAIARVTVLEVRRARAPAEPRGLRCGVRGVTLVGDPGRCPCFRSPRQSLSRRTTCGCCRWSRMDRVLLAPRLM
jgi:hypothetical protein